MSHRPAKPVTGPDGTQYSSYKSAGRALGYSHAGIKYQMDTYGNLDRLAEGTNSVSYKGKIYASVADCSRKTKHSERAIYRHLNTYGCLDNLGVRRPPIVHGNALALTLGKHTWISRKAAADALGVEPTNLRYWLQHADRLQYKIDAALEAYDERRSIEAQEALRLQMQAAAKREGNQPRAWRKEMVATRRIGRKAIYEPQQINALLDEGKTVSQVCAATGASEKTVRRIRSLEVAA